jgi:hypothetical protein
MRIISCFLLALSLSVSGAEKKSPHTCRILFLNGPDSAPKTLHLFDGVKSTEVALPRMNFSPVYKLSPGAISVVLSPTAYALPEEVDPKAPRAKVPAGVEDFYLLLSSDPSNAVAPVKIQVVPADESAFKKGEMLWFNLTANSVGGSVGKQKLAMKARSKTILKAPATKNEDFNVNLAFRIPGKDHLYPLCETKWLHDPQSRTVVFVMSETGSRTPRVMGFSDFREAEKKVE